MRGRGAKTATGLQLRICARGVLPEWEGHSQQEAEVGLRGYPRTVLDVRSELDPSTVDQLKADPQKIPLPVAMSGKFLEVKDTPGFRTVLQWNWACYVFWNVESQ